MAKKNIVLQETVSKIDGAPIVVIATGIARPSENGKTGNMIQVTIMRSDMNPVEAIRQGKDSSVCGDCPHRANGDYRHRSCYVNVPKAVLSIYRAYKRGSYKVWDGSLDWFKGRKVRWGMYGDPSLIDTDIIEKINTVADGWTGYTHQWQNPFAAEYSRFFQASCDSVSLLETADSQGWGTFTVVSEETELSDLPVKASWCPAMLSDNIQCIDCMKCDGTNCRTRHQVIKVHGTGAKNYTF